MKKSARNSTANANFFFFPMGNRAPLVEKEKPKENNQVIKQSKPQRPNTANPRNKTMQEHRFNRPQSSKALFEYF